MNWADSSAPDDIPVLGLLLCFSGFSSDGERDLFFTGPSEDMIGQDAQVVVNGG
jgi:hypothetical protein